MDKKETFKLLVSSVSAANAVTEKHITIIITNDIILNIFFMYFSSIFIGVLFYPLQFSAILSSLCSNIRIIVRLKGILSSV